MGSRGAFESVDLGNFTFKEGGQHYKSIGTLRGDSVIRQIKRCLIHHFIFGFSRVCAQ